jgi:hypothetical protein
MNAGADSASSRRLVYLLLITVAAGAVGGRILAVTRVYEPYLFRPAGAVGDRRGEWPPLRPKPMATLGANDRSRWATIRALVDDGTYVIGHRDRSRATEQNKYGDTGIVKEEGWETIDKVMLPDTQDFYSSKPPFLPTLLAGEYWLLKHSLGWSITDPHGLVVRTILVTINWLPLVISLVLLSRLADRLGRTSWSRFYVVAAGCFGTFVTPFSITLNNHTVAAWSALLAIFFALQLWPNDDQSSVEETAREAAAAKRIPGIRRSLYLVMAGFFASFTACNELPAAALAVALLGILLVRLPRQTLALFVPAALIPAAGFFATNYLAIGRLTPAYGEFGGSWYNYKGSYWDPNSNPLQQGIDWAGLYETKWDYTFNLLVGHHGLFSLSPVFVFAVVGILMTPWMARTGSSEQQEKPTMHKSLRESFCTLPARNILAGLGLLVTIAVIGFYIWRTSNYGGWTSGPRWLMWLTPLFLLTMFPCLDWLASRWWGRTLAYLLLGISVLSVSYPAWNPWRHPWIYDLMEMQRGVLY